MNPALLHQHAALFHGHLKSLFELSKTEQLDDEGRPRHALQDDTLFQKIAAVDFDAVRQNWYPNAPGKNVPCSVDGLNFESNGTYLLEFKSGSAEAANLLRKAYESVMMLIEHDGYNFQRARREITYIVVAKTLEDAADQATGRARDYTREPWKTYARQNDRWKLADLKGVLLAEAYAMSPTLFKLFVVKNRWMAS